MPALRIFEAVVIFTLLVAATCGFGLYLFPATVEDLRRDIPFSYAEMGVMTGAVQAGFMLSALASGALTVRFGPLPVIYACIAICGAALGMLGIASHVLVITACMTILGGSASAIWIPIIELIARIVPREHRGKALGLASSGTSYGVVAISYVTAASLGTSGWRSIWLMASLAVAVLTVIAIARLRGLRVYSQRGNAAAAPTLSLPERFAGLPRGPAAGVLGLMFLTGLTCTPFQTYLSSYLETEKGLAYDAVAAVWWTIGMTGMAGGVAIGALADRVSVRPAMVLSYVMLAAAALLLLLPAGGSPLIDLAGIAFGLAFYAVFGLVPAYVAQSIPSGSTALLLALMNVTQGIGGLLGNVAGGWGKDASGSFDMIYGVMLASALAAAVLALAMPDERHVTLAETTQ